METCPKCGKQTMTWSTYSDYCTDEECGWSFVYPSVETARPGTLSSGDAERALSHGYEAKERE